MAELEAREAGRHVAQFVPEDDLTKATSLPEAYLKAHVATEHTAKKQGRRTTLLEQYLFKKFEHLEEQAQKRKIIEELGKMGAGSLDVLVYHLDRIERGAGDSAAYLAHSINTDPIRRPATEGTIRSALENEALRTLHERAGSAVGFLRSAMSSAAAELRDETHHLMGNPYARYKLDGRTESIQDFQDSRPAFITGDEVNSILHDLTSERQFRLVRGYNHFVDLFNGTLKGAQERFYLDRHSGTKLRRTES